MFRDSVFCVLGEEQKEVPPTIAKNREVKNKREKEKKNSGRTDFSFFRIILISFSQ
jgi:hypothetical protein